MNDNIRPPNPSLFPRFHPSALRRRLFAPRQSGTTAKRPTWSQALITNAAFCPRPQGTRQPGSRIVAKPPRIDPPGRNPRGLRDRPRPQAETPGTVAAVPRKDGPAAIKSANPATRAAARSRGPGKAGHPTSAAVLDKPRLVGKVGFVEAPAGAGRVDPLEKKHHAASRQYMHHNNYSMTSTITIIITNRSLTNIVSAFSAGKLPALPVPVGLTRLALKNASRLSRAPPSPLFFVDDLRRSPKQALEVWTVIRSARWTAFAGTRRSSPPRP